MFKVLAFLAKREGIEIQAFIDYYENNHVPLIRSLALTPIVYKRRYIMRGEELTREGGAVDFDVVTELGFPTGLPFSPGWPSSPDQGLASRSLWTRRSFSIDRGPGPISSRNM